MVTDLPTTRISKSSCPVKLEPSFNSESTSELLFGESVLVLEQNDTWCRIRTVRDGYEGFVETAACDRTSLVATHWVSTKATFVFEKPNIKSSIVQRLLFGSELIVSEISDCQNFLEIESGGYVWAAHCRAKNTRLTESLIGIAESNYLQAPYLWGGRSTDGCDCSGLVQMLAWATGVYLPRDSIDQEPALKNDIEFDSRAAEDLVYWPGHVGVLKSPSLVLHSTAHYLRCCIEPLEAVIQRAGSPSSIKRISD